MKKVRNLKIFYYSIGMMFIFSLFENNSEYNFKTNICYETDDDSYASYSNGKVYIGNSLYVLNKENKVGKNDILVLDERNGRSTDLDDPNYKIIDSYKVRNKNYRNEILEILENYEENDPTKWNRSIESLRNEWDIHNLCYDLNFCKNRTEDVDLNNKDEKYFNSKILSRILNN